MSGKLSVTVLLLCLLCFGLAGQAFALAGSPGVKAGDYFTYSISTRWSSSNPTLTAPEYLASNNVTRWFNVSVTQVLGANVSSTDNWEYYNGTRYSSLVDMEVEGGMVYLAIEGLPAFQGFYPANLIVNDPIHPTASDQILVKETTSRQHAGTSREINVATVSYPVTGASNSSTGTETVTYCIDKQTGVLTELTYQTQYPDQTSSLEWKLTDTNAWNAPTGTEPTATSTTTAPPNASPSNTPTAQPTTEPNTTAGSNQQDFPWAILAAGTIVAIVIATLLYFKKHK